MTLPRTAPEQHVTLPAAQMRAKIAPDSLNEDTRTVGVQYASDTPVLVYKRGIGEFYEVLATGPENVRLDRMKNGAPVLAMHRNYDLMEVIGAIENPTTTHCNLRFDDDEYSEKVWRKVKKGFLRNVSVGYEVHKYMEITQPGDTIRTLKAIDWTPLEVSIVTIQADANAGVRSETKQTPCIIQAAQADDTEKGHQMTTKPTDDTTRAAQTATSEQPVVTQTAPVVDVEAIKRDAAQAERARATEINNMVHRLKLPVGFAATLISEGKTVDQARAAIFDKLAETSEEDKPTHSRVHIGTDERQTRNQAIEDALLHRFRPSEFKLTDPAREFRGYSLPELAREQLRFHGEFKSGMTKSQVAERALHSTSDFPLILSNVANKTLRKAYETEQRTFLPFCREVTMPDFKDRASLQLSEISDLRLVNEGAEYKYGTLKEGKEVWRLYTYGLIIALTRETIINDDLDAFTRVPGLLGSSAARLEGDLVYGILTANPVMGDNIPLFDAAHGNLTNALFTSDGLGTARAMMRTQKGLAGKQNLNITPKFNIVPAALEHKSLKLNGEIVPTKTDDVNPYRNAYQTIVESRLDAHNVLNYYLAADPNQVDTIEYGYLEGQSGPYIETREGFHRDGVEIKIRHDFGAKAADYRGLLKSTNNAA